MRGTKSAVFLIYCLIFNDRGSMGFDAEKRARFRSISVDFRLPFTVTWVRVRLAELKLTFSKLLASTPVKVVCGG